MQYIGTCQDSGCDQIRGFQSFEASTANSATGNNSIPNLSFETPKIDSMIYVPADGRAGGEIKVSSVCCAQMPRVNSRRGVYERSSTHLLSLPWPKSVQRTHLDSGPLRRIPLIGRETRSTLLLKNGRNKPSASSASQLAALVPMIHHARAATRLSSGRSSRVPSQTNLANPFVAISSPSMYPSSLSSST